MKVTQSCLTLYQSDWYPVECMASIKLLQKLGMMGLQDEIMISSVQFLSHT